MRLSNGEYFKDFMNLTRMTQFFLKCDSLHASLNSHYKAWSYEKKKHKKIKAHRKSL